MNYQKRPYHKINFNEKPIFFLQYSCNALGSIV